MNAPKKGAGCSASLRRLLWRGAGLLGLIALTACGGGSEDPWHSFRSTYTISGSVGASGTGAVLAYTDDILRTVTADAAGHYTITVPEGWSGTVTPGLASFAFTPTFRSYTNVTANQMDQDYTVAALGSLDSGSVLASGSLQISGTLSNSPVVGEPVPHVQSTTPGNVTVQHGFHIPIP